MIRTALAPRPVRVSAAVAAVAGAALLSGCSPATTDAGTDGGTSVEGGAGSASGPYTDGTYTAEGSYATPESVESIEVTLTLADDVITAVEVVGDPQKAESQRYQEQFIGGISDEVVGQNIDDVQVSRVAGSSLTSGGFNQALETIKSEAAG